LEIPDDRVYALLLSMSVDDMLRKLESDQEKRRGIANRLPGIALLHRLEEDRMRWERADMSAVAQAMDSAARALPAAITDFLVNTTHSEQWRAMQYLEDASDMLKHWWEFYGEYDPLGHWWCKRPVANLGAALEDAKRMLTDAEGDGLVGDPIGEEAIAAGLALHGIDADADTLIEAAQRELRWCLDQGTLAAREAGLPDWDALLEQAKQTAVPPGDQPWMVAGLAREAATWVQNRGLLTVPALALETWRMTMMPEEAQKTNPFFLGGECIWVSYPTSTMDDSRKRMSSRGNNPAFSRATVQHELIPGHHMQQFAEARYRSYRRLFQTPFWIEGWTLHWEMLLWDLGFAQTPLERAGMLYWRMHRCARVVFSLEFHRGQRSGQECIDYLVETCGHERDNASAEVRRSLSDAYDPLYQLAYLIGGLQVRRLCREQIESGWSYRQFHDRFLQTNQMPIKAMRQLWNMQDPERSWERAWNFLPEIGPPHGI